MSTFEECFCAAEQEAFRFLAADHGFRTVARQVERVSAEYGVFGRVVYQDGESSAQVNRTVVLHIAPLRLELGLEVSGPASGSYSLEELHALDGAGLFPGRVHGLYDAMHDPDQLLAEFLRLAAVLRDSGARFFADEPELWEDLAARRQRKSEDEAIARTLALSKELFRDRDWSRVVDLLSPIEFRLGKRASARLAYAKRKASGVN